MEIRDRFEEPMKGLDKTPVNAMKYEGNLKKGVLSIVNKDDEPITKIAIKQYKYLHPTSPDYTKKMKIHGNVVRLNLNVDGRVIRVSMKVKDFAKNEKLLNTHLEKNALPTPLPTKLEKEIVKLQRQNSSSIQKQGKKELQNDKKFIVAPKLFTELDELGISEKELNDTQEFCQRAKLNPENVKTPKFYRRNYPYQEVYGITLPRSVVCIPNGQPDSGVYMLLKEHGGIKQFGLGSFNRVTRAINLETGEHVAWRSSFRAGVRPGERAACLKASKYPQHFDAPSNFIDYMGNIRANEDRLNKTSHHYETHKTGSIVAISQGGDMSKYLEKKPPLVDRLRVFAEFQNSLDVLHTTLNTTHRDLKPDNINMTEDGHPRIADFGFAVENDQDHQYAGSPIYIPPEVFQNEIRDLPANINPSIDIWSSGVILLQMVGAGDDWAVSFKDRLWIKTPRTFPNGEFRQVRKVALDKAREKLADEGCNEEEIKSIIKLIDQCLSTVPTNRPTAKQNNIQMAKIVSGIEARQKSLTV